MDFQEVSDQLTSRERQALLAAYAATGGDTDKRFPARAAHRTLASRGLMRIYERQGYLTIDGINVIVETMQGDF